MIKLSAAYSGKTGYCNNVALCVTTMSRCEEKLSNSDFFTVFVVKNFKILTDFFENSNNFFHYFLSDLEKKIVFQSKLKFLLTKSPVLLAHFREPKMMSNVVASEFLPVFITELLDDFL